MVGSTGYSLWSFTSFFPGSGMRSGGSTQIGLARARLWRHRAASPGLPGTVSWRALGNESDAKGSRKWRGANRSAGKTRTRSGDVRCRGAVVRRGQEVPERAGDAGCEGRGLLRGGGCGVPGCRMRTCRAVGCEMPRCGMSGCPAGPTPARRSPPRGPAPPPSLTCGAGSPAGSAFPTPPRSPGAAI